MALRSSTDSGLICSITCAIGDYLACSIFSVAFMDISVLSIYMLHPQLSKYFSAIMVLYSSSDTVSINNYQSVLCSNQGRIVLGEHLPLAQLLIIQTNSTQCRCPISNSTPTGSLLSITSIYLRRTTCQMPNLRRMGSSHGHSRVHHQYSSRKRSVLSKILNGQTTIGSWMNGTGMSSIANQL